MDKWVAGHAKAEDAKYEKILGKQTHMAKDGALRKPDQVHTIQR